MNFSFDFHQFLLFFIDIFKTLESVTTLSSFLKIIKILIINMIIKKSVITLYPIFNCV